MAGTRYYSRASSSTSFFGGNSEPSMRDEFINTMDGNFPEIAKAQKLVLRRMNRDSSGNLTPCGCVDLLTHEPDKDRACPICYGMGYLWSESYVEGYKINLGVEVRNALLMQMQPFGNLTIPQTVFYLKYDVDVDIRDRIVEIDLDNEGEPILPLSRIKVHMIGNCWKYKSDRGRVEYIKLWTTEESLKYLNLPVFGAA